MDTWRSEDVVLFPHRNPIEATIVTTFDADGDKDSFTISVGGDHLPEGTDGYIESFWCDFDLNVREARELYDELGRWLKNQDGNS